MAVSDWVSESAQRFRSEQFSYAATEAARDLALGGARKFGRRFNYGTPIWERDWDVLIILDACRYDLFEQLYGADERLSEYLSFNSVASHSVEFMTKTFSEQYAEEMSETVYVTGNPFSNQHTRAEDFQTLDEVWRYAWDDGIGTILADPLIDRAIRHHREQNPERMVIHYMQPHCPYVSKRIAGGHTLNQFGDHTVEDEFDLLKRGDIKFEEHWNLYEENLKYVMENLFNKLLTNMDAEKVVITSDHGNAFGEFGVYGHPAWVPHPMLKRVPWAVTSAKDSGEYEPTVESEVQDDSTLESKLESLGYL